MKRIIVPVTEYRPRHNIFIGLYYGLMITCGFALAILACVALEKVYHL